MKNFNADGLRARNEQKRQFAEAAVIAALRAAGKHGLTRREISQASKVSDTTVRARISELHAREMAHIGPWKLHGTKLVPSYILGPGEDAKRDDYLHLRPEGLGVGAEGEARKEAQRKHAKWARDWRAHRPAEAAWIR